MKKMNKKGFTLVELLAVIVILALIMAIAVVSMSGIMTSARNSTFKETAVQIINGVQQQLTLANELLPADTHFSGNGVQYFVAKEMIEKGGDKAPLGGSYQFYEGGSAAGYKAIGTAGVYRYTGTETIKCSKDGKIFVRVIYDDSTKNFKYSICVPAGDGYSYIDDGSATTTTPGSLGTLEKLLDSNDTSMIKS